MRDNFENQVNVTNLRIVHVQNRKIKIGVDTFVSDEAMTAWAHFSSQATDGTLSVEAVLGVFAEDEQESAKVALASVGSVDSLSRVQFLNFLGDMLSVNDSAVVKASIPGIQWS